MGDLRDFESFLDMLWSSKDQEAELGTSWFYQATSVLLARGEDPQMQWILLGNG